MQRLFCGLFLVFSNLALAQTQVLESPRNGEFISGISQIRGWVCDALTVSAQIDEFPEFNVVYGSQRIGTESICGDNNNGYGWVVNWNSLSPGPHTIRMRADGVLFAEEQFFVGGLNEEFIRDLEHQELIYNFPASGEITAIRWAERQQNFIITGRGISRPSNPINNGARGAFTESIAITGLGQRPIHTYIPAANDDPIPLLIALHGAAGPGNAQAAALGTRDFWQMVAETEGFAVIALEATGNQGSWVPVNVIPSVHAAIDWAADHYRIEQSRIYLWGFSAGGHVAHGIGLQNTDIFAAYAASAGALQGFAGSDAPGQTERKIPLVLSIGTQDTLIPLVQADAEVFRSNGWTDGYDFYVQTFNGGHTFNVGLLTDIWQHLSRHLLPE